MPLPAPVVLLRPTSAATATVLLVEDAGPVANESVTSPRLRPTSPPTSQELLLTPTADTAWVIVPPAWFTPVTPPAPSEMAETVPLTYTRRTVPLLSAASAPTVAVPVTFTPVSARSSTTPPDAIDPKSPTNSVPRRLIRIPEMVWPSPSNVAAKPAVDLPIGNQPKPAFHGAVPRLMSAVSS